MIFIHIIIIYFKNKYLNNYKIIIFTKLYFWKLKNVKLFKIILNKIQFNFLLDKSLFKK